MRPVSVFALLAVTISVGAAAGRPAPPRAPSWPPGRGDSLALRIRERVAVVPGARVAVAYRDLATPDTLYLGADTSFHAASTMKVPVLVELFRAAERGAVRLDDSLLLVNRFASIVDGSPYELGTGDDSDSSLYARVGTRVPVRELAERMIVRSSNLATNALIPLVGGDAVTRTMRALGASRIVVRRGVEDGPAYARGLSNTTTARDLAIVLAAIERGTAASRASCDSIRAILLRQEFNREIPAGLPPGTRVAHKTGSITATLHDAAIVYPPGRAPYVLVVLTGGIADARVARALIADVARLVHAHATGATTAAAR